MNNPILDRPEKTNAKFKTQIFPKFNLFFDFQLADDFCHFCQTKSISEIKAQNPIGEIG
jgi:hypothetical protein